MSTSRRKERLLSLGWLWLMLSSCTRLFLWTVLSHKASAGKKNTSIIFILKCHIAHKLSKSNCYAWHWPIWSRYIGNFKWSASTLTNMKLQPQSHMVLVKPCRLDIKVYSWRGWTAQLVVQKIQLSVKHIKICKGGIKPAANNLKFWMRQNHKKMMFYWLYVNVKTVCRHKRTHSTRHAVSLHPEEWLLWQ